jgi:aminopeptidase N
VVLKTLDFERSTEMLAAPLAVDDDVRGRIDAARALGRKGEKAAIEALGKAAREDAFWGVQAEAARALGSIRSGAALDELLSATGASNPKARRAIMRALGEFRDERAAEALERVIDNGDASYYVEAAATAAIGKTRSERAYAALERSLNKDSFNDVIRAAAFEGFGELKDERAVSIAMEWSRYGKPSSVRGSATNALARLGEIVPENRKEEIVDHLTELVDDPWFRSQVTAIGALATLQANKALPALDRVVRQGLDGRVVRSARLASRRIRESGSQTDEVKKLRADLDKVLDENRSLKDRLDKIESQLSTTSGGEAP